VRPPSISAVAADAIVVLGCPLAPDGAASPALHRRVERAVELYRAGAAPLLVLSGGGGGRGRRAEAEAMRELALLGGVPAASLVLETRSRNTFENAVETAALMREAGIGRVLLVSDAYHLPRAALLFRFAGLTVVGTAAAAPRRPLGKELRLRLREVVAAPRSLLRGWRHARRRRRRPPDTDFA
jgi:uncharacterized SAM-binding protein YcdF (DUF218 family)